jgi:GntR family transcriptional regulator, transcriptional repressor for pyruvate dehydrogenase complex
MSQQLNFRPLNRSPTLADMVAEKLLEAIVAEQLRPGDDLPSERDLSIQFSVSRTVVREAIRELSTKGVVEVISGRGVRVRPQDATQVTEAMALLMKRAPDVTFEKMHEVRLMIEPHAAAIAATRATSEDIATLDELLERMTQVVCSHKAGHLTHRDFDTANRPDVELHRTIAKAAANELYLVMFDSIAGVISEVRAAIFSKFVGPFPFLESYRTVVDSIRNHDPAAARLGMEAHLEQVWNVWHEHISPSRASHDTPARLA